MEIGATTAPSEMLYHPPMTVTSQALAHRDTRAPLKTGMSVFTLSTLFQRARDLRIDGEPAICPGDVAAVSPRLAVSGVGWLPKAKSEDE